MAPSLQNSDSNRKRLVLLDAHAILHRAYHALPEFISRQGEPTGGLYGLASMLLKIISDLNPDYIAACYDLPEPTYRHEAYKDYKAGRPKADEALVRQMIRSRDIFKAFNIPIYEKAGFEADDILGTIVERMKKDKNVDIVIASGDMDTLQLVDDKKVQVYTLKKGIKDTIIYDEKGVVERFGFAPDLLPDFKGLRGDPSDNIPGITGIGEKTAALLVRKFGTIENIYKQLKKDKKQFEEAGLKARVIKLLEEGREEAEFSKMLAEIRRDVPIDFSLPSQQWRESLSVDRVVDCFSEFDFRTLSQRVKELFSIPEEKDSSGNNMDTPRQRSLNEAGGETIDPDELKQTSVALWVLDSSLTNPQLDDILQYAKTKSFSRARKIILGEVKKHNLSRVYEEIELPLIPVVSLMEKRGVRIDRAYLKKLSREYHQELAKLERAIWKYAGQEFNINSPKQLGEVLFERLGLWLKNHKRTSTGVKSTRESELEKLRDAHPIIGCILQYRELQKLLSTYIDIIPDMLDANDRLHATFLQTGTTTGRMSSNNPNLQNIPVKTELGKNIRKAFIATEGFQLVAFDYSQIELRVAAFLSGDEKLTDIFKRGGDVHAAVAAEVFGVPPEQVDKEMRRRAKIINFGILYGMGVNALRQNLNTDRAEAQRFYNEYFKNFSGLARYLDRVKAKARRLGYTETYFGRRRYFEGIHSSIPYIQAAAERMAVNAPIQGTQADIIKIAMVRIHKYITQERLDKGIFLLLQVHDELVYEVRQDFVEASVSKIQEIMESVLAPKDTGGIPLVTTVSLGHNWGEMETV
jgi:DNA polymerase-1